MITAIEIENFKAIRDRVRIDLKPITLLFGPNSAGKSTMIQALHYAREVFERNNVNADRTVAGGASVDLGGFASFVHGHDLHRSVSLRFDLDLQGISLPEYFYEPDATERDDALLGLPWWDISEDILSAWVEVKIEWSEMLRAPRVTSYEVGINGAPLGGICASLDGRRVYLAPFEHDHPLFFASDDQSPETNARHELGYLADEVLRDLESREGEEIGVYGQPSALPVWGRPLELRFPPFEENRRAVKSEAFVSLLSRLLVGTGELLRSELSRFRYLGPLRDVPPRGYEPPRSPDESRWANGLAAWDALASGPLPLWPDVSTWLSRLNSGYGLRVKSYKELDVEGPVMVQLQGERVLETEDLPVQIQALPIRRRVVLVEEGRQLEVHPQDVGVGISQVVPVLVMALDSKRGLQAIEQPDLHLHPAIQVALGDLFAGQIAEDNRAFLLETHSEHLLLRLLRRIRETAADELPPGAAPLRPEQLAVFYVEQTPDGAKLSKLRIDETGEFIDRWPKGFFEERIEEIL